MNPSDIFLLVCVAVAIVGVFTFRALWRRSRGRAASWRTLLVANALLFIAFCAAIVTVGEVYYRFVFDDTDAYQIGLTSRRWVERHYHKNNFAVRDDVDYALEPRVGARRITFLGDSFTNGHGVPEVDDRFVNRVREAHPEWEIHSLAQDGLDTGPMLSKLRAWFARGYVPDVVVYVSCPNDVSDLIPEWNAAAARLYDERPGFLVRSSYLINTWYYRLRVGRDSELARYFDWVAGGYSGPTWQQQSRRLRELRSLIEAAGGELVVVDFPFLELRDDDDYLAVERTQAALWAEEEVPHLDLTPVFSGIPTSDLVVNRYDSHPNERAHALAADAIGGFLERVLSDSDDTRPGRTTAADRPLP